MPNTAHESEKAELWPGKPFPGAEPANSSGHYVLGTVPNTVVHGHRRVMSLSKFLKEETEALSSKVRNLQGHTSGQW